MIGQTQLLNVMTHHSFAPNFDDMLFLANFGASCSSQIYQLNAGWESRTCLAMEKRCLPEIISFGV
jgi:hypothetical protein